MKRNQNGFTVVELFIVIAVVVGLGFIGYRVYQNNSKKTNTAQGTTNTSETNGQSTLAFDNEPVSSDPIGDPNGPFYHDLYLATSSDGLTFVKQGEALIKHASVPDIIKLSDGRIAMYAVDAAQRSTSGLLVGISEDDGKTWQFGSVRFKNTQPGSIGADPEVVLTEDGKIRMYYISFGGSAQNGMSDTETENQVKSAISEDGINFTLDGDVNISFKQVTDPDVVKIGDKWFAYLSQGPKNIAFSATDPTKAFMLERTVRENGSVSNTISIGDSGLRQYFCSSGFIKSATTKDGLSFTDDPGNRLEPSSDTYICDPAPLQVSSGWIMVYKVGHK